MIKTTLRFILTLSFLFAASSIQARDWVHPGALKYAPDLAFTKAKVEAGEQPWAHAFEAVYNHPHDQLCIDLPNTNPIIDVSRPTNARHWVRKWETLCYANREFGKR